MGHTPKKSSNNTPESSKVPRSWWFFFVGVLLVVGAILLSPPETDQNREGADDALRESTSNSLDAPRRNTFDTMLQASGQGVYVENQPVGARSVSIGAVKMNTGGFVTIHADDNGRPGDVIGVSDYLQNDGEDITIDVNRPLAERAVYYAMLYADNGDRTFATPADTPMTDNQNNILLMSFTTTQNL